MLNPIATKATWIKLINDLLRQLDELQRQKNMYRCGNHQESNHAG